MKLEFNSRALSKDGKLKTQELVRRSNPEHDIPREGSIITKSDEFRPVD